MKRIYKINNVIFEIGNRTPRRNEFERGQKYRIYADGIPTGYTFATVKEAKSFIFSKDNYYIYM